MPYMYFEGLLQSNVLIEVNHFHLQIWQMTACVCRQEDGVESKLIVFQRRRIFFLLHLRIFWGLTFSFEASGGYHHVCHLIVELP